MVKNATIRIIPSTQWERLLADVAPTGLSEDTSGLEPEEALRAAAYHLLAGLLGTPPDAQALRGAAALTGDASPLGKAVSELAAVAGRTSPEAAAAEYQALFIGLGRGEVVPFASYYLTGFLQEKPLARLRQDMQRLGIERDPAVSEPEDHIASILEMLAGLIDGSLGDRLPLSEQKTLYERHIASWAPYFFRDLEAASSAELYAALAIVGAKFLEIEDEAFRMI